MITFIRSQSLPGHALESLVLPGLHLAFARNRGLRPAPMLRRARSLSGAFPVAAWAEDGLGGALGVVGPIAVLCLVSLAGVFLQSLRDGLLIVAGDAHSYRNHPIELRRIPHLDTVENVGLCVTDTQCSATASSRSGRNWLALAGAVNDLPVQLWIADPDSMLRGKLRAELLELVGAGDGQCSPLLRAQLESRQNSGLILGLPDFDALSAISEADMAWIGA